MRTTFAMTLLAGLVAATAASAETYVNGRFGTTVEFPAAIFDRPQPPPANGDGQSWLSADRAELAVFGSYNVLEQAPADFFETLVADRKRTTKLTYSRIEKSWGVVSGFEGDRVYYEKYLFGAGDETVHAVILRYPAAFKAKYDPLVGPIANSLAGP